jgi:hypothetical protein
MTQPTIFRSTAVAGLSPIIGPSLVAFLAAALAGLVLGAPDTAVARWWGLHPSACREVESGFWPTTSGFYTSQSASNSSAASLVCPIPDTDQLPKWELTDLWVYGRDGSTVDHVSTRVCVGFYNSLGGACGAYASTSNATTGNYQLHPSLSAVYDNPDHYAYLFVSLAPRQGTSASTLAGYDAGDGS